MSILNVPSFCLVTGASRGLGRAVAIQLAQKFAANSSLYLIARDKEGLNGTAEAIGATVGDRVKVTCVSADLSSLESVQMLKETVFGNLRYASSVASGIMIHNAGSLGVVSKYARDLDDAEMIQKYNTLNLTVPIALTSEFLKVLSEFGSPGTRRTIVNVTAMAASVPIKTFHMYGMVKAGRDMFFRVMAFEEPKIRILTFDPGAVDTEMYHQLSASADATTRKTVANTMKGNYFLKPEQSAAGLVKALEDDKFKNAMTVKCFNVLGITSSV